MLPLKQMLILLISGHTPSYCSYVSQLIIWTLFLISKEFIVDASFQVNQIPKVQTSKNNFVISFTPVACFSCYLFMVILNLKTETLEPTNMW